MVSKTVNQNAIKRKTLLKKKKRVLFKISNQKLKAKFKFDKIPKLFGYKSNDPRLKSCSIKYLYDKETIQIVEKEVQETKKKNNKLLSLIFFLVNIVVITVVLILNNTGESISPAEIFANIKWKYVLIAFAVFVIALIVDSSKYLLLIWQSTRRFRPYLSFKVMALGKYYDNITPLSAGGEPAQIYYLNKRGVKAEVSTSIPLMRYIYWQIAFVAIASIFLISNLGNYVTTNPIIVTLGWVGLAINAVIVLTVLLLSTSKKVGPRIVIGILKLLHKLKVVKNYQAAFRKTMKFVMSYQRCMRAFAKNFGYVVIQLILAAAEILLTSLIAYYIYLAFVPNGTATATEVIAISILCNLAVCFIPMPGGSGVVEYSFITVYGSLFPSTSFASWATLLYRVFTYYFILLIGILVIFYDFLIGNKKAERHRRAQLFKDGFVFKDKLNKLKAKSIERRENKMFKQNKIKP